jgi:hypothetical protein
MKFTVKRFARRAIAGSLALGERVRVRVGN